MSISNFAKKYLEDMFSSDKSELAITDKEFIENFNNFAFDEVVNQTIKGEDAVDNKTRMIVILSTLLGCGGIDVFKIMLPAAIKFNVTPIEIKEIVYQAVAYLGIGRVYPFLIATNNVFEKLHITLPLKNQSTTTTENRLSKGVQTQVDIFGDGMKEFYKSGPEESRHINRWLACNCFGDYYTRNGLNNRIRELITFCYIAAQGGCEPQLTAHAIANLKNGNNKQFLINIVSSMIPYIGYPRSLNAQTCINNAYNSING